MLFVDDNDAEIGDRRKDRRTRAQDYARAAGFLAMQFNFVVSSNERAVRLWKFLGFGIVGRLPAAFRTPSGDYVDALVMFKPL